MTEQPQESPEWYTPGQRRAVQHAASMLAEYVRATAAAFDEATHEGAFQEQHAASIRTELLED